MAVLVGRVEVIRDSGGVGEDLVTVRSRDSAAAVCDAVAERGEVGRGGDWGRATRLGHRDPCGLAVGPVALGAQAVGASSGFTDVP